MKTRQPLFVQAEKGWYHMTPEEMENNGYLVIVWTPTELTDCEDSLEVIRDACHEAGNEAMENIRCQQDRS